MSDQPKKTTTSEALQLWREAERTVAVARRGKLAATAAVIAAQDAEAAARATAAAAKSALESATLAEASAHKTAASARLVVEATHADMADADAESAIADVGEAEAREGYRRTMDDAGP